jgi:glutathione S-transferase
MGTPGRAQALRWISFMASEIYPMIEIYDYPARFAPEGEAAEALKQKASDRIRERMLVVEQAAAGPWFLANGFCATDIYAAMFRRWRPCRDWQDSGFPKIVTLAAQLSRRPAISPIWARHFGN